ANTSHKFMSARSERRLCRRNRLEGEGREGRSEAPGGRSEAPEGAGAPKRARLCIAPSRFDRWVVPGVDGPRQEPLPRVGPELGHVRIGVDGGIDELAALLLAAADVEGAHHVAEVIEGEGSAGRVGERYRAQGPYERVPVFGLPTGLLESRLGDHAVDVEAGGVRARDVAVVAHHPVDEALVARGIEIVRVEVARDHP